MRMMRSRSVGGYLRWLFVGLAASGMAGALVGCGAIAGANGPRFASVSDEDPTTLALERCAVQLDQAVGTERLHSTFESKLAMLSSDNSESTLVASGQYSIWCQGTSTSLGSILVDSPWYSFPNPDGNAVLVGPRVQDVSEDGDTFVLGRAGSEVDTIKIDVPGADASVALSDGWWTASWPTGSESELDRVEVTFVTGDGQQHTAALNKVLVDEDGPLAR